VGEGDEAVEVLNYEQVRICRPAVARGRREGLALADFLRDPLTRKYGPAWYAAFRAAVAERTAIKEAAEPTS
ncbi:MAG TPA: DUF3109 family protein, partial [Rubricoccaceae bacterium]|nr:DUF3109 family protein [Rubricoccaceae bacterium]